MKPRSPPTIANGDGATFVWTLAGETVGTDATYTFTPEELANFQLTLSAENEDGKAEPESITIRVVERFTVTAVFPAPSLRFGKEGARNVSLGRTLYLRPVLEHFHNPTFEWTVKDRPEKGDKEVFAFTPAAEGEYTVTVKVTDDDGETATATAVVTCCGDEMSHKRSGGTGRFSDKVYEYTPAPGQFINESVFKDITSADAAASKAQELLRQNAGEKKNYYVSLGAWGGYIVVGFDHSIENKGGNDFSIAGNQFAQSSEPGIVWVMQDTNGNGLPDDEWYELKGSEYGKQETLTSYAMTYYRPKSDNTAISWKDNRGNAGTVERNSSHEQGYYPGWIDMESYTLYGTRLAANTTRHPITGDYYNNPYDWGYADNAGSDQLREMSPTATSAKLFQDRQRGECGRQRRQPQIHRLHQGPDRHQPEFRTAGRGLDRGVRFRGREPLTRPPKQKRTADFPKSAVLFQPGVSEPEFMNTAGHRGDGLTVDPDVSRRVGRYGDLQRHAVAAAPPLRADFAAHRVVGCRGPVERPDEMGSDDDAFEPGSRRIEVDARQIVDIPRGDVAQKDVVDRGVAPLGRKRPRLGQRRETLADPPAPRRRLGLGGHPVSRFDMTVAVSMRSTVLLPMVPKSRK